MSRSRREGGAPRAAAVTPAGSSGLRMPLAVLAVALAVRAVFLLEGADYPAAGMPVVDAYAYHSTARQVAAGGGLGERFFWQPFFYPLYLSGLYWTVGPSVLVAKLLQALLGGLTCALTAVLGRRLFGATAGAIAGLITAFYGPLIYYELELLAAGWAAFWSVVVLLGLCGARRERSWWYHAALGCAAAAAVLTRPTFLPFLLAAALWLAWDRWRAGGGSAAALRAVGPALAAFLVVVTPVALVTQRATGELHFTPASGGVNLYIGNHPDTELLARAADLEWDQVVRMPLCAGIQAPYDQQRFFYDLTREYALADPLGLALRMGRKGLEVISSRELPRNEDLYVARRWSVVLGALAWKVGGFGFPFGLLLPLALLGMLSRRREVPAPLWLFSTLYPLAIALVFVTSRYRVPIVPALAVLAGAGCVALVESVRAHGRGRLVLPGVGATVVILLASLPGPFALERVDFEPVLYETVARALEYEGRPEDARELYERALEVDPDSMVAHTQLGNQLRAQGRDAEALGRYERALALAPDLAATHLNVGVTLDALGRRADALDQVRESVRIDPCYPRGWSSLGSILFQAGLPAEAADAMREAVRLEPGSAQHRYHLGLTLMGAEDVSGALAALRAAVGLSPGRPDYRLALAQVLERSGDFGAAAIEYRAVLQLDPTVAPAQQGLQRTQQRPR